MWLRKSRKEPVLSHISMKNLPESERPYERFQILGAEALSDAELLAIILKTGTQEKKRLTLPVTWTYKQKKGSATVSVITVPAS